MRPLLTPLLRSVMLLSVLGAATALAEPPAEVPAASPTPTSATAGAIAPAPPATGTVVVAVDEEGVELWVDDRLAAETPAAPLELPPGRHRIAIRGDGGRVLIERTVDVQAGARARLDLDVRAVPGYRPRTPLPSASSQEGAAPAATPWYLRWYVLAGAGVLVAAAATVVILAASSGESGSAAPAIPVPPIE